MMKPLRPDKQVIDDWLKELSERLGRSTKEIKEHGLGATDFSAALDVEIRYATGLQIKIPLSFALIRPEKKQAVVFSEHEGYLEFDLEEDDLVAEIHEELYRQR